MSIQMLEELESRAISFGVEASDLTEEVRDAADDLAGEINRAGLREQLAFLLMRLGDAELFRLLSVLPCSRSRNNSLRAIRPVTL